MIHQSSLCVRNDYTLAYDLVNQTRLGSPIATEVTQLLERIITDSQGSGFRPFFTLWKEHNEKYLNLPEVDAFLHESIAVATDEPGLAYFLAQSYCHIVVEGLVSLLAIHAGHREAIHSSIQSGLLSWCIQEGDDQLAQAHQMVLGAIGRLIGPDSLPTPTELSNHLSILYQEMFPASIRHLTGEYYTPAWLVDYCLSHLNYSSIDPYPVALDPGCGSGIFLVHWAMHMAEKAPARGCKVYGFDINPLAVAIANSVLAYSSRWLHHDSGYKLDFEVRLSDVILDPWVSEPELFCQAEQRSRPRVNVLGQTFVQPEEADLCIDSPARAAVDSLRPRGITDDRFDSTLRRYLQDTFASLWRLEAQYILGNPPWISWDGLKNDYRQALAVQWNTSPLNTQRGWYAKVAAGKTDISSLFVYRSAERFAAAGAEMVFVLPMSLFQSRRAAEGFRRFTTSSGRKYALAHLDDFSSLSLFNAASNRASVAYFHVDSEPAYPIPCRVWQSGEEPGMLVGDYGEGQPIDGSNPVSPIIIIRPNERRLAAAVARSDYRARGGVNTGGGNTVFWVDVGQIQNGKAHIANCGRTRRSKNVRRSGWVETELIYRLITGPDVKRWRCVPSRHILLCYSADSPKQALSEDLVRTEFPLAYRFLLGFKDFLENRREYHRWGARGPFYEVYRIGPYTFAPIKVVWQHTGFKGKMRAAVIDDRGKKVSVPDQKVILVAIKTIDEAHYLCAYLNSGFVSWLLDKYLGLDASTHIMDFVGVKTFDQNKKEHMKLVELSVRAHEAASNGQDPSEFEEEIDRLVLELLECRMDRCYLG